MPTDAYAAAVQALSGLGPLRVWSVLVTVFGDLAPDAPIDGPTLSALMSEIGIRPEATRVALHRLRADGWVTSQKEGRRSLHRLSQKARDASDAARPRIYGATAPGLSLYLMPPNAPAPDGTVFAQVAPRLYFGPDTQAPAHAVRLAAETRAPWMGAGIETDALRQGYADVYTALAQLDTTLTDATALPPLHVAALRVLIVHAWRRLALKHPHLPRAAHSADWREHDAQKLVLALLHRLPRPEIDQLTPV